VLWHQLHWWNAAVALWQGKCHGVGFATKENRESITDPLKWGEVNWENLGTNLVYITAEPMELVENCRISRIG